MLFGQPEQDGVEESGRRLDHRVVAHPFEADDGGVRTGGGQRVHHGGDGDRVIFAPDDVER